MQLSDLYPWVTGAIGGLLGAAFLLPTKLGEAIFKYRIDRAIEGFKAEQARAIETLKAEQNRAAEAFKADQAQRLERLREQLSHLGDRGKRSNEMEFDAIEIVWKGFVKAWLSANTCVSGMISIPDFEKMSDEEATKFAASYGFSDDELAALLSAADRREEYVRVIRWKNITHAEQDIYQARLTLREQRIFMPPEITKQFGGIIERMSEVQVEQKLSVAHGRGWDHSGPSTAWVRECVAVFEDMATKANKRLFRDEPGVTRD
jgi:hypothetical protein